MRKKKSAKRISEIRQLELHPRLANHPYYFRLFNLIGDQYLKEGVFQDDDYPPGMKDPWKITKVKPKKPRGRPKTKHVLRKKIIEVASRYKGKNYSLNQIIRFVAKEIDRSPGYIDRHFKKEVRKGVGAII